MKIKSLRFNENYDDERAETIIRDFSKGKFDYLLEVFKRNYNNDWDFTYFYAHIAQENITKEIVDELVKKYPNDSYANLVAGAFYVKYAWDARGHGAGEEVSSESGVLFVDRLKVAVGFLNKSVQINPSCPVPHVYIINAFTGLGMTEPEVQEVYKHARNLTENFFSLEIAMMTYLSEKWYGSHDKMLAFAEQVEKNSPIGSNLKVVKIAAILECFLYIYAFDNNEEKADAYITSQKVIDEGLNAYKNSIGSKEYKESLSSTLVKNYVACWMGFSGARDDLPLVLDSMNGLVTPMPWEFFNSDFMVPANNAFLAVTKYSKENIKKYVLQNRLIILISLLGYFGLFGIAFVLLKPSLEWWEYALRFLGVWIAPFAVAGTLLKIIDNTKFRFIIAFIVLMLLQPICAVVNALIISNSL